MKVYSVFDSKAEAYLRPFYADNHAVALRSFAAAAADQNHDFHRFAADYTLFYIGDWEEHGGALIPAQVNQPLGCAIEFINAEQPNNLIQFAQKE